METFSVVSYDWMADEFKSYYVVWKLHTTDNKNITQATFKSYYVVWKRFFATKRASAVPSLNRTM